MRALIVSVLLLSGCTPPIEKECNEAMPVVEAARANPNDATLANLKAYRARDQRLNEAVVTYTKTIERVVESQKAFDQLVAALKMKPEAKGTFQLSMFDKSRPYADQLARRCYDPEAPPDCAELTRALEACIAPEKDDTTVEEQLLTCANKVSAVHSPDKRTNESIKMVVQTMHDLEPVARNVGAPAKEVIRVAKDLSQKISDGDRSRAAAKRAELEIRKICQPGRR